MTENEKRILGEKVDHTIRLAQQLQATVDFNDAYRTIEREYREALADLREYIEGLE